MPRTLRFLHTHAVHHATLRCNNREFLFTDSAFGTFVALGTEAASRYRGVLALVAEEAGREAVGLAGRPFGTELTCGAISPYGVACYIEATDPRQRTRHLAWHFLRHRISSSIATAS